jgi:C-terminal processing protease CtpA/Prc
MAQAVYDGGSCSVGMGIVKSAKGFEVRTLVKYGPAELSKQIQSGDMLHNVDGRSTTEMSLESLEAVSCCSAQSV